MPSSAAASYQDLLEGKLISAVTTATTTGVTVKVKQINGATPTWTTVAHRLKVIQRTATNNKAEVWQVAAGTTQNGQTVTLGTLTRALPLGSGTDFTGSGTAQSFAAGADVFLTWDAHDAAQTPKLDIANTFTASQTFSSGLSMTATDKAFVPPTVTTTQRDAIAGPTNGMIVFNSTTGVMNQYVGGVWTTFASGTTANAANNTAGKVDLATAAENAAGTATDATSGAPNVIPTSIVKATSTGAVSGTVPMLNTSVRLDGSIGGIGVASPVLGALLIGGGAGLAMTAVGPGSSGQVPTSNGTTLAMASPTYYNKIVFLGYGDSGLGGANSSADFQLDTNTYTIPANDLASGVAYRVGIRGSSAWAAGTQIVKLFLGTTSVAASSTFTPNGAGSWGIDGILYATAAAGASVTVRFGGTFYTTNAGGSDATYMKYASTAAIATNGNLVLAPGGIFGTGNGSNTMKSTTMLVEKISTTLF